MVDGLRGKTLLPVEVIGLHILEVTGVEGNNTDMFTGKKSPWLRETAAMQPFNSWSFPGGGTVLWRDAVIVNARGEYQAVQSLTNRPLESGTATASRPNATALFNALSGAANPPDTDLDGLPDTWELQHYQSIANTAMSDPTAVGRPLLLSYAQGFAPTQRSIAGPVISEVAVAGQNRFQIEFRRLVGLQGYAGTTEAARLTYTPEVYSSVTKTWTSAGWTLVSDTDPYDGTGTRVLRMRAPIPSKGAGAPASQFVRLKVTPRL